MTRLTNPIISILLVGLLIGIGVQKHTDNELASLRAQRFIESVEHEQEVNRLNAEVERLTQDAAEAELRAEAASATVAAVQEDNEALTARLRQVIPTSSRSKAASGWRRGRASWYGSAFYGRTMAGGGTYGPKTWGVAHKTLPFGTRVQIRYRGKTVTAPVLDRGPYVAGRVLDLSYAVAQSLGFSGVQTVEWRVVR